MTDGAIPSWAPAGGNIVFLKEDPGGYTFGMTMLDGTGRMRRVATWTSPPVWSPDGTRLAFSHGFGAEASLSVINLDGSGLQTVAQGEHPAWSPDGKRIAYDDGYSIHVVNADGSGDTQLSGGGKADDSYPAWSPDGSRLAFARQAGQQVAVFVVNQDGTGEHGPSLPTPYVVDPSANALVPVWSPDGTRIAFDARASGQDVTSIWVVNADGSRLKELPHVPGTSVDRYPRWSPDGTLLAFVSDAADLASATPEPNDYFLFTINPEGTGLRRLPHPGADVIIGPPSWSPDGRTIAFSTRSTTTSPDSCWRENAPDGPMYRVDAPC